MLVIGDGHHEALVPRRRTTTVGVLIVGASVLLLFAHTLFADQFRWPVAGFPAIKAGVAPPDGRALSIGTAVLALDGTSVGSVSGLSRNARGHVERILVTGPRPMGLGQRTLIIRHRYFRVAEHAVQLNLSLAELDAMPEAMPNDKAE